MTTGAPIACTLDAGEMPGRLAEMVALGRGALVAVEGSGRTATLRFIETPEYAQRLRSVVAAESRCCAFLNFELVSVQGLQVLRIEAPEGGEFMLDALVASFRAEATETVSR